MSIKYSDLTFISLFLLFIFFAGASLTKFSVQSDQLIIGLATILAAYTIALVFVHQLHRPLKRFKFGLGGVEADFTELEERALDVKEEETPPEVKAEMDQIQRSDTHPYAVFLVLIGEVERKLRLIAEAKDYSGFKYRPIVQLSSDLLQKEVISNKLYVLIKQFSHIRNEIVHGIVQINDQDLKTAINAGEIILTELDKVYKKTSHSNS